MLSFDAVKEFIGFGKPPETVKIPQVDAQQQKLNDEALKAWNNEDPHPADKKLIAEANERDQREIANTRAELSSHLQQTQAEEPKLNPVEGIPGEIMEKYRIKPSETKPAEEPTPIRPVSSEEASAEPIAA